MLQFVRSNYYGDDVFSDATLKPSGERIGVNDESQTRTVTVSTCAWAAV